MHEGTKTIKINKLQQLTSRFESIRMSKNESFDEFYTKLNDICQVLKTQDLCIQNSNLYCWQTMIKKMCLEVFKASSKLYVNVKLELSLKQEVL